MLVATPDLSSRMDSAGTRATTGLNGPRFGDLAFPGGYPRGGPAPPYPFALLAGTGSSEFDLLPSGSISSSNLFAPGPLSAMPSLLGPPPLSTTTMSAPTMPTSTAPSTGPNVRQVTSLFSPPKAPQKWTPEEDDLLRESVARLGSKKWKVVAQSVPGRSHIQCLQRWNKVLKPGIKKGAWTSDEDELVRRSVEEQSLTGSTVNWAVVASAVPGRTAKQCRERWRCNLDPNILKADWTREEDEMLFALQRELGNRWALISKSLPGRTENAIKTRFRSFLRAEKKKWSVAEDATVRLHMDGAITLEDAIASLPGRTRNAIRKRAAALKAATTTAALMSSDAAAPGLAPASAAAAAQNADGALVKRARLAAERAADAVKRGRRAEAESDSDSDEDEDDDSDDSLTSSEADENDDRLAPARADQPAFQTTTASGVVGSV